jgi:pimeloyl-ACP methyl ester carboxylesterase
MSLTFLLVPMLATIEQWLTFKPNKTDHGELSRFQHERISFGESHDLLLDGAIIPSSSSERIVLFIHGNKHNITRFGEHYNLYQSLGYSCFTFDFPGYGKSAGKPSEASVYASAHAAYEYVKHTLCFDSKNIIIYGCSLGGAVAIELAQHVQAACLITESTFTNTTDMALHLYPWLPIHSLLTPKFNNKSKISSLSIPHLLIHGTEDTQVPLHMAHQLHLTAAAPAKLITVPAAGHTDSLTIGGSELINQIKTFIESISDERL